ncbi:MAG TPA: hypothetical protein VGU61_03030 [Noviherbaspirillum sp.]|uniref:hypothetical protein n=1 Tax=Noviherbaspirillum sp. TaxID=1926288 RepID=UPI002DDD38B1|nr:hypothetical protein [Noviherbaspirillum sp.]HEV2609219.1 hypothetical protein [Noviherbaspirillum sp.]
MNDKARDRTGATGMREAGADITSAQAAIIAPTSVAGKARELRRPAQPLDANTTSDSGPNRRANTPASNAALTAAAKQIDVGPPLIGKTSAFFGSGDYLAAASLPKTCGLPVHDMCAADSATSINSCRDTCMGMLASGLLTIAIGIFLPDLQYVAISGIPEEEQRWEIEHASRIRGGIRQ